MNPHKQLPSTARVTFGDLSRFIRSRLDDCDSLRAIARSDYNQLVLLERELFPDTSGIFDAACVRHSVRYFPYSILVGKSSNRIEAYFSFFPLTARGFQYCLDNKTTTICQFPAELFKPKRQVIKSIFLEVLASKPTCSYQIKRDAISIAVSLLRSFSHLPFLSCPVSHDGLRILEKLDFRSVKSDGLNSLYLREPKNGAAK
jgi:hypothetical protein